VLSTQKHFTNGAGGSIESTGTGHFLETGHFIQGEGTTSGEPVVLHGGTGAALEFEGGGASSFLMDEGSGFGLSGTMSPSQSLTIHREDGDLNTSVSITGPFTNEGSIVVECGEEAGSCTGGSESLSGGGTEPFTNKGTIVLRGRGTDLYLQGKIVNEGTFEAHDESRFTGGTGSEVINEGTVKIADGAVLSTQKHFTNGAGGSIESTGTGHFLETGHFIQGEGTTSGEPVHFTGGTGAALELTGSGESSFLMEGGSSFGLSGNLAPLQSLAIYRESGDSSATVSTSGAFTNAGTLLIGCGTEAALCTEGTQEYLSVSTAGGAKLTNTGAITLQGRGSAARLLGNVLNEGGTIVAHDYARITGGSFEQTAGTTSAVAGGELEAPSLALAGGTLGGGGTFTGSVVNSGGTVSPGASPGILTIGGDYTQESSGALSAEIEGATVGAQYDRLVVEGAASLDGTLAIFSAPGFVPADGQQFTVLSAGSLSGSFSNVTGTYVPGGPGNYGVAVGSGEVVLAYVAVPRYALTVAMSGTGSGSVTCDGGSCASSYLEGTTVTLGAVPAAGSSFAGWSGAGCSGTGNCVVTLNADTAVTASFSASPPPTGTGPPPTGTGPPPTGTGPPPNNSKQKKKHTYGQCVAAANKAFKKAKRAARHKHGRARAQAIKVARKRRGKRVAKCRKRFGKRRHGKHRKRHRHRKRTSRH